MRGKVCNVALAIWFKAGVEGRKNDLAISKSLLNRFSVERNTGSRILSKLEQAGLVTVERKKGRSPHVTIQDVKAGRGCRGS